MTYEQQPLVNNGHYLEVPRMVAENRFDCIGSNNSWKRVTNGAIKWNLEEASLKNNVNFYG